MAISDTKLRTIYGKPYSGPSEVADADGLSARISPKGVIQFQYRYRWKGKPQRLGLGRYPSVSLKEARRITADLRELYFKGVDPRTHFESRVEETMTVKDCLDYWFENYVKLTLRPKTQALYEATVIKRMTSAFPGKPISSITIKQWVELFAAEERENPRRARQVLSQMRTAISWCMRRQVIESCTIMGLMPRDFGIDAGVGERVLTYSELADVWLAIERSRASTSNKLLHQMMMMWGCRISELRLSERKEFDLREMVWTVPGEHSKMGNLIRRPIFPAIQPFVDRVLTTYDQVLYPGQDINTPITIAAANRFVKRIREGISIEHWTSHDFRRTLSTRLSEQGVAPHVIEKMLGHELGGVMAVYNKHDWIEEQREAYELHADKIFWHVRKISG